MLVGTPDKEFGCNQQKRVVVMISIIKIYDVLVHKYFTAKA
jgi:hypothetical protein